MGAKHDGKSMPSEEPEEEFIFRRFFRDKNGVLHDARRYGKRAWKIPVKRPK